MDRARRVQLLVALAPLVLGGSSFVACTGERSGSADSLRRAFPEQADEALVSSRAFEAHEGTFSARASHGFDVTLPSRGDDAITFEMQRGDVIRVREEHATGTATRVESAVRYQRPGGASYWSLRDRGVEEWLALEPEAVVAGRPAASWTVEGGRFMQIEDAIAVVDDDGRAMLRVAAPVAYGADGREIHVDLRVADDRLVLNVDADGERVLVDPFWFDAGDMNVPRKGHVAVLLQDGRVLITGGVDQNGFRTASTEIYHPNTHVWLARAPMPLQIDRFAAALLPDGDVLVTGGFAGDPVVSARRYDVTADTWSNVPPGMNTGRMEHTATALPDGRIFIAGGSFNFAGEIFDPSGGTFTTTTGGTTNRNNHTATLLPDGRVLLAGGGSFEGTSLVEIYDPAQDAYVTVASLNEGRTRFGAVVLPDGRVLVSGGGSTNMASTEIYDVANDTWTTVAPMNVGRSRHTLSPLPDGRILAAGGSLDLNGVSDTASAEVYDPASDVWTTVDALVDSRHTHTATPLPDGTVLVAGGTFSSSSVRGSGERFTLLSDLGDFCQNPLECATGFCVESVCCESACTGECQTCNGEGPGTCEPRLDGDLCTGGTCQGGSCVPDLLPNGDPCSAGAQCFSGFCIDDVCCGTACAGECQACALAEGAPQDGTCGDRTDGSICSSGVCEAGACVPDTLPNGEACGVGSECDSGFCVDSVCCESSCFGECNACSIVAGSSADGLCDIRVGQSCTNPFTCVDDNVCASNGLCVANEPVCPVTECLANNFCSKGSCAETPLDDGTPCSNNGLCQGGICIPEDPLPNGDPCVDGIQCESGSCFDDVCCNVDCFGSCQACSIVAGGEVDGVCGPVADGTDCGKGFICSAGECLDLRLDGTPCDASDQCLSGNCVDDVCCDSACVGECVACSIAQGGDEDGLCAPIDDGTDCGSGGTCESGECSVLLPNGDDCSDEAQCESGNCVDDVCCNTACVGACVACSEAAGGSQDGSCQPVEDGTACEGGSCSAGLCVQDAPKGLGEACEAGDECESEECVDGVCCDSACDGECEACSTDEGADENGTCSNATGRECDDGNACTQSDVCEDRACAGSDPVTCTPADCQISSSCNEDSGACVAVSKPDGAPCEGGVCIAGACQTDPDVGSLSGSGTGAGAGSPSGGPNGSGPSGTASGPNGATGAGAGSGSGDDEDGNLEGESDDGCAVGGGERGALDLAWLAVAAAVGARWRAARRRARNEGHEATRGEGSRTAP